MAGFNIYFTQNQTHSMPYLHNHDYYELYFQVSGTRSFFCNNQYYQLTKNSLTVIAPHVLHKFEGGPYQRFLVIIPTDDLPVAQYALLDRLHDMGVVQLKSEDMKEISCILDALLSLNEFITKENQLQVSLTLGMLLYKLYHAKISTLNPTHALKDETLNYQLSPTILKIMDYIKNHYKEPITYKTLCQHFNLSKAWIAKGFLQANGLTVFQYKLALQLNEAQHLLRASPYSIEKIASLLGFSSVNYFCKVFKSNLSITPLQFRKFRKNNQK